MFENWKTKKDEVMKEQALEKKKALKEEREMELDRMEKKKLAQGEFEKWKEKRPISARKSTPTLTQRSWCPSGRQNSSTLIPNSVQPVVLRASPGKGVR